MGAAPRGGEHRRMLKKTLLPTAALLLAMPGLAAAAGAPAGTYFIGATSGNTEPPPVHACPAGDVTVVGGPRDETELSGFGVVTSFRGTNIGAPGAKLTLRMAKYDMGGSGRTFTVVGSVPATLDATGSFDVPARIPVENGDRIALSKAAGQQVACAFPYSPHEWSEMVSIADGIAASGASTPFRMLDDHKLMVAAAVEPDADGDGYGDNSQDRCKGQFGRFDGCVKRRPTCRVPNVGGMTLFAAREKLGLAGCRVGTVKRPAASGDTPIVIGQSKAAGRKVPSGTKVALTLGTRS
jgi:hypothetical protein